MTDFGGDKHHPAQQILEGSGKKHPFEVFVESNLNSESFHHGGKNAPDRRLIRTVPERRLAVFEGTGEGINRSYFDKEGNEIAYASHIITAKDADNTGLPHAETYTFFKDMEGKQITIAVKGNNLEYQIKDTYKRRTIVLRYENGELKNRSVVKKNRPTYLPITGKVVEGLSYTEVDYSSNAIDFWDEKGNLTNRFTLPDKTKVDENQLGDYGAKQRFPLFFEEIKPPEIEKCWYTIDKDGNSYTVFIIDQKTSEMLQIPISIDVEKIRSALLDRDLSADFEGADTLADQKSWLGKDFETTMGTSHEIRPKDFQWKDVFTT